MSIFTLNKSNPQVLHTKIWLFKAMYALMKVKPFSDITVGRICEKAKVSRSVFYNHYSNKEELLFDCFKSIMDLYDYKLTRAGNIRPLKIEENYLIYCSTFWQFRGFFVLMYKNKFSPLITDYFFDNAMHIFDIVSQKVNETTDDFKQYYVRYHTTAMIDLIMLWLQSENAISSKEMAKLLLRLCPYSSITVFNTCKIKEKSE